MFLGFTFLVFVLFFSFLSWNSVQDSGKMVSWSYHEDQPDWGFHTGLVPAHAATAAASAAASAVSVLLFHLRDVPV